MNTTCFLTLTASTLLAFVGCNRAPNNVPANGFRLTVQEIIADSDVRVTQLAIRSAAPGVISIDAEKRSHHMVSLPADPAGSGSVTLMASRVAPSDQPWAYMQTLIRTKANGESGGATSLEALPHDTLLADFFTVTAKSGDYSFDTPVEVATLRGKPVTLTLKRGTN